MRSRSRGFTLIEVLIALLVLSILGFTVTSRISSVANQTYQLERRTMAHWVAQNQLQRIQLSRFNTTEPLTKKSGSERVNMGHRDWLVRFETFDTDHPWMKRMELKVYELTDTGDEVGPIHSAITFVGRY